MNGRDWAEQRAWAVDEGHSISGATERRPTIFGALEEEENVLHPRIKYMMF